MKALHTAGGEGAKARKYEKCSSNRKVYLAWRWTQWFPLTYLPFFPLGIFQKSASNVYFIIFLGRRKSLKMMAFFCLRTFAIYWWACHTLFLGLVVDPQMLFVTGHWAAHYLLCHFLVCVCVFNNEKAKNDQKHFLLLCWSLIIEITQNAGRKWKSTLIIWELRRITPKLGKHLDFHFHCSSLTQLKTSEKDGFILNYSSQASWCSAVKKPPATGCEFDPDPGRYHMPRSS